MDKIPVEYKKIIAGLFPEENWKESPPEFALKAYAAALGITPHWTRLETESGSGETFAQFLSRFEENLDLLIAKTWVEKDDEERRLHLRRKIPAFIARVKKGDYVGALQDFSCLVRELAYLLFGEQSQKEDFVDYAFRIDGPLGLFFWYGLRLDVFSRASPSAIRGILLLGMCYLTDF